MATLFIIFFFLMAIISYIKFFFYATKTDAEVAEIASLVFSLFVFNQFLIYIPIIRFSSLDKFPRIGSNAPKTKVFRRMTPSSSLTVIHVVDGVIEFGRYGGAGEGG